MNKRYRIRKPDEIIDIFNYNVSMLNIMCEHFDSGKIEASLWIAVILRTLLNTKYNKEKNQYSSLSILDQLINIDSKYNINFINTSLPVPEKQPGISGWKIDCPLVGAILPRDSYFTGLVSKHLSIDNDEYKAIIVPLKDVDIQHPNESLMLKDWLKTIIFKDFDTNYALSRWNCISTLANMEGGAHLDPFVSRKYDTFRNPEAFKVYLVNKTISFNHNPLHVSVRQMAWEVLESFKRGNII